MRLRSLVVALLLIPLFAMSAGAIYIEGQAPPDDGLMHIMSASTGPGMAEPVDVALPVTSRMQMGVPAFTGTGIGLVPEPEYAMPLVPGYTGTGTLTGQLPTWGSNTVLGIFSIPSAGQPDSDGNIVLGGIIGHISEPAIPGYWDDLSDKDLHTNMPMLSMPALFGL